MTTLIFRRRDALEISAAFIWIVPLLVVLARWAEAVFGWGHSMRAALLPFDAGLGGIAFLLPLLFFFLILICLYHVLLGLWLYHHPENGYLESGPETISWKMPVQRQVIVNRETIEEIIVRDNDALIRCQNRELFVPYRFGHSATELVRLLEQG